MANNQLQQPNIEQARDLLSPYLDGEVTAEERVLVEEAIATSVELRRELETLRQTVFLLRALPPMPAPRPFTLTEADVQPARPAPRRGLTFPTWLKNWGMLAATLLCVLAIGGVFLSQQFGGLSAPAEIAFRQEAAAPPAALTEAEQAAPAAPAAEEAPAEEAAVEKETPAELAAEKEEAASDDLTLEVEVEAQPEVEIAADEATAEMTLLAREPDVAEEAEAEVESKAAAESAAPESDGEAIEKGAVQGTASPLPTAAPLASPTPVVVVEQVRPAEAPAAAPPPAPAEGAPAGDGAEPELGLDRNAITPRPVEIQNLRLQLSPGVIQLRGSLEANPGTPLVANIQRNGEPFDSWADPATLQTTVQPDGQFSFNIQANTGRRADRDLFASEPAGYQITITALDPTEPVIAAAYFDTFGPPAATEQPPPSFTPHPTPTAVATVALAPSPLPTPTAVPTSTPRAGAVQTVHPWSATLFIVAGLLLIGGLVALGLGFWLLIRKRRR